MVTLQCIRLGRNLLMRPVTCKVDEQGYTDFWLHWLHCTELSTTTTVQYRTCLVDIIEYWTCQAATRPETTPPFSAAEPVIMLNLLPCPPPSIISWPLCCEPVTAPWTVDCILYLSIYDSIYVWSFLVTQQSQSRMHTSTEHDDMIHISPSPSPSL